jgi:hypothetical protein
LGRDSASQPLSTVDLLIAENFASVRQRIAEAACASGRRPEEVRLVAVTKTVAVERIRQAASAGMCLFGENKIQEAVDKIDILGCRDMSWHFIGHLQKNKVKFIFGRFDLIHSVDGLDLAEKIHAEGIKEHAVMPILLQVNVSGEAAKFGVSPEQLEPLLLAVAGLSCVRARGLMTIPPFDADAEKSRKYFARLRELRDKMKRLAPDATALDELSMGMSNDYAVAVEEGATLVRVGTALFGTRANG